MAWFQTPQAIVTGGCFWTLEAVFERMQGIRCVRPVHLWMGAGLPPRESLIRRPEERMEGVRLAWDPTRANAANILEVLLTVTSPNLAGWETLSEMSAARSALFLSRTRDASDAESALASLAGPPSAGPSARTQIVVGLPFHRPAPAFDRGYYRQKPDDGFCRTVIGPKLARLRALFPNDFPLESV